MVHGFIDRESVLMSEGGNVYHLVQATFRVNKWTEHVLSLGQMADLPSRWPERISDPKPPGHEKKINMSQVELIPPSQANLMSPISLFDKIRLEMQ